MKSLFRSEKGSVSIYLMIIIVVVFVFNAVLIDYARILIAEKQTERAVDAGVRSVLSSYDNELLDYGLFGFDGDQNQIFSDVVQNNLSVEDKEGTFQFVDTKADLSDINLKSFKEEHSLANLDIFEEQVLQNMKYIAPIEFTKLIIEQFTNFSSEFEQATVFVDVMSRVKPLHKARETALDEIDTILTAAKPKINDGTMQSSIQDSATAEFGTINHISNIDQQHAEYKTKKQELTDLKANLETLKTEKANADASEDSEDSENAESTSDLDDQIAQLEEDIRKLQDKVDNYESNANAVLATINSHYTNLSNQDMSDLLEQTKIARDKNLEIKSLIETEMKNLPSAQTDEAKSIKELNDNMKNMYYEPEILAELRTQAETLHADVDLIVSHSSAAQSDYKTTSISSNITEMQSGFKNSKQSITDLITYFNENRKVKTDEMIEEEKKNEEESDKLAKESGDKLDNAKATINAAEEYQAQKAIYNDVESKFETYKGLNETFDDIKPEALDLDSHDSAASSSMSMVGDLTSIISDGLYGLRDKLYVNEYIMRNFTSKEPYELTDLQSYYFHNKEIEYILYGFNDVYANYATAYGQVFAFRFAINVVEVFLDPLHTAKIASLSGFPISAFLYVVTQALIGTELDMRELMAGESIDLINIKNIKLLDVSYRDHLRFFLLANPGYENRIMRTQAVLDKNKSVDLSTRKTYVEGEVTSTVKLWFLPGAAKMFNQVGLLDGKVVDKDRYQITKEAGFSY